MPSERATQTKRAAQRRASLEELLAKRPAEREVPVHLDPAAVERLEEAQERLNTAKYRSEPKAVVEALERQAQAAKDAVSDTTVTVLLRALGRENYERLLRAHLPTEEEKTQAVAETASRRLVEQAAAPQDGMLIFSPTTFPPALIAACAVEPEISVEAATEMYKTWSEPEFGALFLAAFELNTRRRVADLGKG